LSHRDGLGNALYRNYRDNVLPSIAEASRSDRASRAAAFALYDHAREEQVALIGALLRGHPRAFSPELTVEAGAESVKALRTALAGPWPGARDVLDMVATTQQFWNEFDALLEMDQEQAMEQVKRLAEKARTLENPVGLALLHHDRTSWSGLVQSAYVADAKEAAFRAGLLLAVGRDDPGTDPISGGPLKIVDGKAVFQSKGDDAYPFIKALADSPVPASLGR
jgi:hypothetical protein